MYMWFPLKLLGVLGGSLPLLLFLLSQVHFLDGQ